MEPVRTKEEEARYQLALKAQRSSPLKPTSKPKMAPGPALSFKKKENSTSGDDKALEKVRYIETSMFTFDDLDSA